MTGRDETPQQETGTARSPGGGAAAPESPPGRGEVSCTPVELGEKGLFPRGGRLRALAGAVRFGLAQARALRSRQATFLGWAAFSAALGAWVMGLLYRRIPADTWAVEAAILGGWFLLMTFASYLHLDLVRRQDGTPWRSFLLPNGMTLSRLLLAPLLFFASLHATALRPDADLVLWPLVYLVASDLLDGQIARFFGLRSEWGRLADPAADILLASWFAPGLWAGGLLAPWVGFLIVFRYAGTLLAVFAVWGRGRPLWIAPTLPGRAANLAGDVFLPALLAASIRWPSWLGSEWMAWLERVVAALVVINITYLSFRLARAWTSRR